MTYYSRTTDLKGTTRILAGFFPNNGHDTALLSRVCVYDFIFCYFRRYRTLEDTAYAIPGGRVIAVRLILECIVPYRTLIAILCCLHAVYSIVHGWF